MINREGKTPTHTPRKKYKNTIENLRDLLLVQLLEAQQL